MIDLDPKFKLTKFGQIEDEVVLADDEFFWVVQDKYPLFPGHILIISKSAKSHDDLSVREKDALSKWIDWAKDYLKKHLDPKPDGFTLAVNDGLAAGQTKDRFHYHVVPRRFGDVPDPRGGFRNMVAGRGKYWVQEKVKHFANSDHERGNKFAHNR